MVCPNDIHTATDPGTAYATLTWNAPEVKGGADYVEVNITEELGQEFLIGNSSITYAAHNNDGIVLTNCSFDIHVFGKHCLINLRGHCTPTQNLTVSKIYENLFEK